MFHGVTSYVTSWCNVLEMSLLFFITSLFIFFLNFFLSVSTKSCQTGFGKVKEKNVNKISLVLILIPRLKHVNKFHIIQFRIIMSSHPWFVVGLRPKSKQNLIYNWKIKETMLYDFIWYNRIKNLDMTESIWPKKGVLLIVSNT